ncbi:FMN-dependent NADH-azoreductase [Methylibium sp.]|uniref:FMN-dependent NADH-azoreductase n=1 Tax=Methylibium sp. TaxID=2067992 RepID=UPI003D0E0787
MSKLLHVVGSPRQADSRSAAIAALFLETWRELDPLLEVDTLDLWQDPLPEFDGDKAAAKMTVITGAAHDQRTRTAWDLITGVAARFTSADAYLFTVPMWNGGIPYRLKLYIDILMQPGVLFGFDPDQGYRGLLTGKRAAAIYTSGVYESGLPAAFGMDFHSTYFDWWLRAIGIEHIESIRYQPTLRTAQPERVFERAANTARAAATRMAC